MTVDGNVAIDPANGGIRSNGCTNTVISNNIVTTQTERPSNISAGITVGMPSAGSPGGEISITGNVIDGDQFENGIWIWGDSGVGSQGNGVVIDGNTIVQTGTDSPASPRYAITVFRWDNAVVSGNRINDAFEGISVASSENSSINGNSVTNCVGGAGRGIRTDGVTDCVVYNNVSNGNTIAYELDSDDTTGTVKRDGIALDNTGTPSVLGSHIFITGGTTAITNFEDGFKYQTITILAEHSVTITNNATIILSAGANFNMTDTDSLDLIRKVDGNWYETSRSVN